MFKKSFAFLKSLVIVSVFWPSFAFSTLLVTSIVAVVRMFDVLTGASPNRTREHAIACYWPRLCWLFNFWWLGIKLEGKENLPAPGEAVVMVANHESMFDIFIIYFTHSQFRWLSKKEMFSVPVIGQAMKWLGYVPVDRGNPSSHAKALEDSADWIRRGIPMFFFPEGTRSTTTELRSFKVGAFRLARETNVAIQPIAIIGARNILPKGAILPRAAKVRIKILPKMRPTENESNEDFAARVRQLISDTRST